MSKRSLPPSKRPGRGREPRWATPQRANGDRVLDVLGSMATEDVVIRMGGQDLARRDGAIVVDDRDLALRSGIDLPALDKALDLLRRRGKIYIPVEGTILLAGSLWATRYTAMLAEVDLVFD